MFVPGSFSKLAAWKPIYANLKQSYRVIETSLCGYGQTSEIRSTGDLAMSHQFDVLVNVTTRAATPLHIVGHSFGATIALIFALENPKNVLSLTLFEPNPLCFLREDGCFDALSDIDFMYAAFCKAVAHKNPDPARLMIDLYSGVGFYETLPELVKRYCHHTLSANLLDWRKAKSYRYDPAQITAFEVPALLVSGRVKSRMMRDVTYGLYQRFERVAQKVLPTAGHFLIRTYAADCAGLIERHISDNLPLSAL